MNLFDFIKNWINENPGKSAGAFIGFVLGIFILTIGLLKILLIIIFILIGIIIGKMSDDDVPIIARIKGLFNRNRNR